MPHPTTHVEAAAADFGRHSKGGGGWALGLAVAACIHPGNGQGRRSSEPRSDRDKVSAQEFARQSGTTASRVIRHLDAWKRAAARSLVVDPDELTPADWNDLDHLPEGYEWNEFYDATASGGRPRDSRPEDAVTIIDRRGAEPVVDALTDDQVENLAAALHERRPNAAQRGATRQIRERAEQAQPAHTLDPTLTRFPGPDATHMDIDAEVARLHSAITRLMGYVSTHQDTMRARADRLSREAELCRMLADAAAGVTDADLDAALAEWSET